jgi:hypothetical protein
MEDRPICERRHQGCTDANLRLKPTLPDGNCMYHAIARVLSSNTVRKTYTIAKLRKLAAFRIKNASDSFIHQTQSNFVASIEDHHWLEQSARAQHDPEAFRSLWAKRVLGNEWGDETILQLLSDHFFITFLVLDNQCRLIGKTYNPKSSLVSILHLEGAHYSNIYHRSNDMQEQYIHEKQWLCVQSFGERFREENTL